MRSSAHRVGRGTQRQASPMLVPAGPTRLSRWALYGFVFSLPFDAPGRFPLELTTMTGALFVAATMLQPVVCYGRRPAALWLFAGYLYAYWVAYVLGGGGHTPDAIKSTLFFIQGLLIFCAAFNLMRDERIARRVLLTLVAAAAILAIMTILGIGKALDSETQRATVFGQNANRAARVLCAGLLAAIGLVYGRARKVVRPWWLALAVAAVIGLALILGGSRGGLIAMAAGLWMFSLTGATFGVRVRNTVVSLVAIALAVWGAMRSPLMQRRVELAMQGNLAKREVIFPAAWQMFKNRPLYGYGASNQYVLATRLGLPPALHLSRDTHNLFLELLTASGLLGTVPFLAGLWLCCWGAWKARRGTEGILPAAQMIALLVGNLSGNYIALKLQWVLLAYALASYRYLTPRVLRPTVSPTIAARRARWG
jgi:O-antigen ligase